MHQASKSNNSPKALKLSKLAPIFIFSKKPFKYNAQMKRIKVAVVGTGFIGPAHIEALRRLPNIEVAGLCEATLELAQEKAQLLGIEKAYIFEDMLQDASIEVVHICTPNFLHYPQAKA